MRILTEQILKEVITKRPSVSYKGNFGRVLIIGGNPNYGGAVIMNAMAAVHSGAGLVSVATDPSNFTAIHCHTPEAMVTDYQQDLKALIVSSDVVLIGSGLGDQLALLQKVLTSIEPHQILIIDGSALTLLAQHPQVLPDCHLVLTPHQMEWERLSHIAIANQNQADLNWQALQDYTNQPLLVLKSNHTQIYTENEVYQIPVGGPYQATDGMGDTLAGMIAGFAAQFKPLASAVMAATYAHSAIAQELAQDYYVTLPTQISGQISPFMRRYSQLDK